MIASNLPRLSDSVFDTTLHHGKNHIMLDGCIEWDANAVAPS